MKIHECRVEMNRNSSKVLNVEVYTEDYAKTYPKKYFMKSAQYGANIRANYYQDQFPKSGITEILFKPA